MPAIMGTIQCMLTGVQVQANHISPVGIKIAAKHTTDTIDSGAFSPVSGSSLWELIMRLIRGSHAITMVEPTAIPQNDKPVKPGVQPRISLKTIGYATKHKYKIP